MKLLLSLFAVGILYVACNSNAASLKLKTTFAQLPKKKIDTPVINPNDTVYVFNGWIKLLKHKSDFGKQKQYYYMWSYNYNGDDAWGENDITLPFKPTEDDMTKLMFPYFKSDHDYMIDSTDKPSPVYIEKFVINTIEEVTKNPNTLQNQSATTKAKIAYKIN